MHGNLPRSVNPLVSSLAGRIATGGPLTTFETTALDSIRRMRTGFLAHSNVVMTRTISPELGWDWRLSKGSFTGTTAAFGQRVPSREARHFTLRCWRPGLAERESWKTKSFFSWKTTPTTKN